MRFSRRTLREAIAWGDTQTKTHLARLVELEYLVAHRTKVGGFEYELVYEIAADDGARFPGLADIEALKHAYDGARSGQNESRLGSGRPPVGPRSVGGRVGALPAKPASMRVADEESDEGAQMHCSAVNGIGAPQSSYMQHAAIPLAAVAVAAGA